MNHPKNHLIRSSSGYTLIGVLLIITIISVIGVSLIGMTSNSVKISSAERDDQSVFYIAEAGLRYELSKIEQQVVNNPHAEIEHDFKASEIKFEKTPKSNYIPRVEVKVKSLGGNEYVLASKGTIGEKTRTLEQKFTLDLENGSQDPPSNIDLPEGIAIMTLAHSGRQGNIMKLESGSVIGKLAFYQSKSAQPIKMKNVNFNDEIYVPHNFNKKVVNLTGNSNAKYKLVPTNFGEIPKLPDFPEVPSSFDKETLPYIGNGRNYTLDLDKNLDLGNVKIDNNASLTIHTNDIDREIVFNDLQINGHINVTGKGDLVIYVKGNLELIQGTINNNNEFSENNVYIFLKGKNKEINTGYNFSAINASIFAEDADVIIRNGEITGSIFTGGSTFLVENGPRFPEPILIFAPNASFTHKQARIVGTIIANNFELNEWGTVEYQTIDPKSYNKFIGDSNHNNVNTVIDSIDPVREIEK